MPRLMKRLVTTAILLVTLWIVYTSLLVLFSKKDTSPTFAIKTHNDNTLDVQESACKVPILDLWDKSILSSVTRERIHTCKWTPQLTYINGTWLKINLTVASEKYNISYCAYQIIHQKHTYKSIHVGKPKAISLHRGARLYDDFIRVSCYGNGTSKSLIYRNYHALIADKDADTGVRTLDVESEETAKASKKGEAWNVLLIGTDSVSHSSSVRYLPKTRKYLMNHLKATDMLAYTKVGENTFPNIMPLLTGQYRRDPEKSFRDTYDQYPLIFKNFSAAGYKTLFADDVSQIESLFYHHKQGFKYSPADYYFRPLGLATRDEKYKNYHGCEEYVVQERLIFDYLTKFVTRFQNKQPFFGFTYLHRLSHDHHSETRRLDQLYVELLTYLDKLGIWDNTALFFYSDHGPRLGRITITEVGRREGKMPIMYLVLPRNFNRKFPQFSQKLRLNSHRLTTAFDTHQTLLDILSLRNAVRQAAATYGVSLLSEVPTNRTCISAGIPLTYCVCYDQETVNVTSRIAEEAALFLVNEMNILLKKSHGLCSRLRLHKLTHAVKLSSASNIKLYQLVYITQPGFGRFEGTVRFNQGSISMVNGGNDDGSITKGAFSWLGPTSRLNRYGEQAKCMKVTSLKPFCCCKDLVKKTI